MLTNQRARFTAWMQQDETFLCSIQCAEWRVNEHVTCYNLTRICTSAEDSDTEESIAKNETRAGKT